MTTRAQFEQEDHWPEAAELEVFKSSDERDRRNRERFLTETESQSAVEHESVGLVWKDPIHEWVRLDDPVVVDMLATPAFERLWHVQQHGERWAVASLVGVHPHSRAEHSLGVWHLIDRFGPNDPALHVAALLHDAGHTAFSHHGEFAFDADDTQSWHESALLMMLEEDRFGIQPVLDRHGIDPIEVVANLEHPLLDFPKPDLCADRLDYIFRDGLAAGLIDEKTPVEILGEELATTDDYRWYFETPWSGDIAQRLMLLLDMEVYKNPRMWEIKSATQRLLLHALERGYLEQPDIAEGTDDAVMEKLWGIRTFDPEFDQLMLELNEHGIPRSRIEMLGHVMDNFGNRFGTYDTQQARAIDPLCGRPPAWEGPETGLYPLSHWLERGYDARIHEPARKIVVHLKELPSFTPEERSQLGLAPGVSTASPGGVTPSARARAPRS